MQVQVEQHKHNSIHFNLDTRGGERSSRPRALYHRQRTAVAVERENWWPPLQVWTFWKRKNMLPLQ